ncbi:MAG: holin family protein [Gammaproteobacteria bacterium]|nr:holin family protein [Gammaproteobacteria bacterium]
MPELSDLAKFSPWGAAADTLWKLLDRFLPNPEAKAAAQLKIFEMERDGELKALDRALQITLGQVEVNKVEAANPNVFTSGWRPYIGWICGSALAFQFMLGPLLTWAATLYGKPVEVPRLDIGDLMTVLAGMLGLAKLRTDEKKAGVAR